MCQFVEMMFDSEFLNKNLEVAWYYFDQLTENTQFWVNIDRSDRLNKTKPNVMTKKVCTSLERCKYQDIQFG